MKESYKLADGSLSSDYEVGDTFVVVGYSAYCNKGGEIKFWDNGGKYPWFLRLGTDISFAIAWEDLTPTEETKRKYQKNSTSPFTKSDLQDGMRVTYRSGDVRIVLEGNLVYLSEYSSVSFANYATGSTLREFSEDLTHADEWADELDIMRVEDRDGTLLFERQESAAKRAVTLELTDEQIQSLKGQGIL